MATDSSFNINCYYLLGQRTVDSTILGDISGPFSLIDINNLISSSITPGASFTIVNNTIIYGIRPPLNLDISQNKKIFKFVVGIPMKNNNNVSRKQLYNYMANYNIPTLMSITPYISQGGNDTGEGSLIDNSNCILPVHRKIAWKFHQFKNPGYVNSVSNVNNFATLVNNNNFNRMCLAKPIINDSMVNQFYFKKYWL